MVGHKLQTSDEITNLRKLRKPMIEKKRRERINTSIDNLRQMLTQSRPEIDAETKLDKAEILELTVNHLTKKQHKASTSLSYCQGFTDCSRETIRFFTATGVLDPESLMRLQLHLQQVQTSQQLTVPVSMTTRHRPQPRVCSTPEPFSMNQSFPGNFSMTTSPLHSNQISPKSVDSFMCSYSDDSSSVSTGSDLSLLGNIISDEKPWRPW